MELDLVVTPGLGDNSYLLTSGREAVVVDPQRDVDRLLSAANARDARIRAVLETHVHNDYVSGAAEVRSATGAEIVGPAGAGYRFAFRALEEGDEILVGDLRVVALATPGHTTEHTSYAAYPPGAQAPVAVFSGGSLIVGSAGRTDLLGADRAEELARAQHGSVRRFLELPDETLLLPTHGAGSFCASGPPSEDRTSTVGRERASNPALRAPDEATFVREQLADLPAFPAYYAHMAPINRAGPPVLGGVPELRPLSPAELTSVLAGGTRLVDAREGAAFAQAHVTGSLNVPLEDSFGSYVGWLVPFGTPIVVIALDAAARSEIATQLFRIGFDVHGYLDGGIDAWATTGGPVSSYPVATLDDLVAALPGRILDVRQRTEWEAGHLQGSRHLFIGDLPEHLPELVRAGETLVTCASGHRASMAASLLDAAGGAIRVVADGGVPDALAREP
jgi:glyoxylase-like metal-dependent hydrolase (beta-lactamase superfamily II)/rhodanese-related sulfurtransferase